MEEINLVLESLVQLLTKYSAVYRKSTQPFTYEKVKGCFPNANFNFNNILIRESLLEHVGSLPIIAATIHPYLERKVDLGKVLIMLSIHDIGETLIGDDLAFTKDHSCKYEQETALKILHNNYHNIYREFEDKTSGEALFANSVDKIVPDIYDLVCGREYTINRLVAQANWNPEDVIDKIRRYKRPFMLWSPFLTKLHDEIFLKLSSS
jgi:putative hydrolases of HD superfamily